MSGLRQWIQTVKKGTCRGNRPQHGTWDSNTASSRSIPLCPQLTTSGLTVQKLGMVLNTFYERPQLSDPLQHINPQHLISQPAPAKSTRAAAPNGFANSANWKCHIDYEFTTSTTAHQKKHMDIFYWHTTLICAMTHTAVKRAALGGLSDNDSIT